MVGGSLGGDERRIALSHSLRIMLVVFTVPVWFQLLGAYAAGDRAPLGPPLGALAPVDLVLLAAPAPIGAPIVQGPEDPGVGAGSGRWCCPPRSTWPA